MWLGGASRPQAASCPSRLSGCNSVQYTQEMPERSGRLSTARKSYECVGGPGRPCGASILPGDTYFCLVLKRDLRYVSKRYCLNCAQLYHAEDVKLAGAVIKSAPHAKRVKRAVRDSRFVGRQSQIQKRKPTRSEEILWTFLADGKFPFRFERQKTLHGFVVDFYCARVRLGVELDGAPHRNRREKDSRRDALLSDHGIRILRFPSMIVFHDVKFLITRIQEVCEQIAAKRNGK